MNLDRKVNIEESWYELLKDEFDKDYFQSLITNIKEEKKQGNVIYPKGSLIFNAFKLTPCSNVKAVIIGQDPYHNPGEAMGLCFSVPKGQRVPPSLRNIYKELNADINFTIPSHGDLSQWADNGVLLLNAILTVRHKNAGSHRKLGWQQFTDKVISKISDQLPNVVFILWGNFAKSKKELIDSKKHLILESSHPSPLAGKSFFNNHHFSLTNEYLISKEIKPINWQIT